jgi:hypothetical protein
MSFQWREGKNDAEKALSNQHSAISQTFLPQICGRMSSV